MISLPDASSESESSDEKRLSGDAVQQLDWMCREYYNKASRE